MIRPNYLLADGQIVSAARQERPVRATSLNIDSRVLGMSLFLMTEVMLFAGLISACLMLRSRAEGPWPPADQPRLPAGLTLANTAVLLASGVVLLAGTARSKRWRVGLSLALGALFFIVQGVEWSRLITFGIGASAGGPFAGIFYGLIGTHALHVLGGLICLAYAWRELGRGRDIVHLAAMYWTLVVAVWPILYALVYM